MKKAFLILLALAMLLSLAACSDKGSGENVNGPVPSDPYEQFVWAMEEMRSAGDKLTAEGLHLQAESCYAFSGSSLSSMRYAVETILWLKGEGDSIEELTEGSRNAGWDEIAAVCYASPYPYYFEGLLLQIQGEEDKAVTAYKSTLLNPAYPEDGVDFYYLRDMEIAELYALRDELREREQTVYDLFAPGSVRIERDEYCFYPDYLRARSGEALEAGDNITAAAYAKTAVLCDPFDPLSFRNAVLCCVAAGELDRAAEYLDAGLLIAPEDEGLLLLWQAFESIGGGGS